MKLSKKRSNTVERKYGGNSEVTEGEAGEMIMMTEMIAIEAETDADIEIAEIVEEEEEGGTVR